MSTSSNWCLLIGQPRSSKSTGTWLEIAVDVASESDVLGRGIDGPQKLGRIGPIAQGLDAAGGGAAPIVTRNLRVAAHLANALHVVGRGDRAFDQRDVVRPWLDAAAGFEKVHHLQLSGQGQQFVLRASNESWQPSHEANLNTASRGVRIQSPSTSRNGSILS